MAAIKNSFLAGIFFGVSMGIVFSLIYESKYGIISGIVSGLFFGIAIYLFVNSKTIKNQTQIKNIEGQEIIYSGGANHFVNNEGVGGKLYLLTNNVQFKSHNFNIQNHSQTILLNDIKEIGFCNTLGIVPNGLFLRTDNGTEKFVVNNRKIWKDKIEIQKRNISSN